MDTQIKAMTPGAKTLQSGAPLGNAAILSCIHERGKHWSKAQPYGTDNIRAATGVSYDAGTVDAELILEKLYGYAWPQYPLFSNIAVETRDVIKFTARVATKFTGSEKVKRLEEPTVQESTYADIDFALWKNAAHVMKADESTLEASHDIMGADEKNASRDIERMRETQIVTALQAATNSSAGTDWGLMTTPPNNDFDPGADFDTALTAIEDTNGWDCDAVYLHRKGWSELTRNTYTKDSVDIQYVNVGGSTNMAQSRVFTLSHKTMGKSLKVVVSTGITNSEAIFQDSTAPGFMVGKGPMIAEQYRLPTKAGSGYVIWDYLEPKEVVAGAAYEFTTITA